MLIDPPLSPAPLFDRTANGRSFVPTNARQAGERSGGQGRPFGRRDSALPLTAASTTARLRLIGTGVLALALGLAAGRATAQERGRSATDSLATLVSGAALRFGIPETWIRSVMHVESAFNPRAVSSAGAMGLMQVMPQTYAQLRARYGLGADPYHPRDNILAGAAYLREMYDRYGAAGFLAAYNAGPGRYEEYLAGRPLPLETRAYVIKLAPTVVGGLSGSSMQSIKKAPPPTLFVQVGGRVQSELIDAPVTPLRPTNPSSSPIFATLTAREAGQ